MSFEASVHGGLSSRLPQPGSLEYIHRPNPVEPSTLSHGSLDGSARELDRTTNEQLRPFLLGNHLRQRRDIAPDAARLVRHSADQRVSIAAVLNDDDSSSNLRDLTPHRREADQALFHLPKLPVKRGTKRHRVPPVLQGLHQPPPNAGILPSISTEETQAFLSASRSSKPVSTPNLAQDAIPIVAHEPVEAPPEAAQGNPDKRPPQRNKWTDQETEDLLKGVAKFGIGNWKKILLCPEYNFHKRTAVDLKDRFRVCRPDAYGGARNTKSRKKAKSSEEASPAEANDSMDSTSTDRASEGTQPAPKGDSGEKLWKARRRPRRNFTAEEDEALLKGFQEQGASWVSILKHPVFQEHNRTPTDLRDRFRTKYPEKYAEAGLASRPTVPKPATRTQPTRQEPRPSETPPHASSSTNTMTREPRSNHLGEPLQRAATRAGPSYGLPFPSIGDDSLSNFGFPEDDDDSNPIVLDRSIVDWANSTVPPSNRNTLPPMTETSPFPGIDPLVTLKLPKPGLF